VGGGGGDAKKGEDVKDSMIEAPKKKKSVRERGIKLRRGGAGITGRGETEARGGGSPGWHHGTESVTLCARIPAGRDGSRTIVGEKDKGGGVPTILSAI